jgi:COX assembly protein 1
MSFYYGKKKSMNDVELPTDPSLPAWIISPKEERAIFERWRKKTFEKCDAYIKAYVECSNKYPNPLEAMKMCEQANKESLGCVAKYQKQKYLDIERDLLIEEKIQRKKELYKEKLKQKTENNE